MSSPNLNGQSNNGYVQSTIGQGLPVNDAATPANPNGQPTGTLLITGSPNSTDQPHSVTIKTPDKNNVPNHDVIQGVMSDAEKRAAALKAKMAKRAVARAILTTKADDITAQTKLAENANSLLTHEKNQVMTEQPKLDLKQGAIMDQSTQASKVENDLKNQVGISANNGKQIHDIKKVESNLVKNEIVEVSKLKDILAAEAQGLQKGILHLTMGPGNVLYNIHDLAVNKQIHTNSLQTAMVAVPTGKKDTQNRAVFDLFLTKKQFDEMKPGHTLLHMVGGQSTHIAIGTCHIIEDEDQFKNVLKKHYEEHFNLSFVSHASGHRKADEKEDLSRKRTHEPLHHETQSSDAKKENALLEETRELDKELHEAAKEENAEEIKAMEKGVAARTAFNDTRRKQNENITEQHEKVKKHTRNIDEIVRGDRMDKGPTLDA